MARIRSLKPEHKQHRKIGPLTDRQYRLWVGMLTEADDEGRLVADVAQLRLLVFGYHPDVTIEGLAETLAELQSVGLIHTYRLGEELYAHFPSWEDHQRIDKPKRSQLPLPTCCRRRRGSDIHKRSPRVQSRADATLASTNDPRVVGDSSPMNPRGSDRIGSDQGSDRIGGEGKGGEPQPIAVAMGITPTLGQPTRQDMLEALARSNGTSVDELKRQAEDLARQTAAKLRVVSQRR